MKTKVVLMLVEGATDSTVLVPSFTTLLQRSNKALRVEGEEMRCDVTVVNMFPKDARDAGLNVRHDVRQMVREKVEYHLERSDYSKNSFTHVVQVIDLDGAFVADADVVQSDAASVRYEEDRILTPNRERQLAIMRTKRTGISDLLKLRAVGRLPYRLFYVSRNIEHAFAGENGELDARKKQSIAALVADAYARDTDMFGRNLERLYKLHMPQNEAGHDWWATWEHVRNQGKCSLQRGSNLLLMPQFVMEG